MDDVADGFLRRTKGLLRPLARALVLSTFLEDGVRMGQQFSRQTSFMAREWALPFLIAAAFILFSMVAQVGVAARCRAGSLCGGLGCGVRLSSAA